MLVLTATIVSTFLGQASGCAVDGAPAPTLLGAMSKAGGTLTLGFQREGKAAAGIRVRAVEADGGLAAEAATGADGVVSLALPPGAYTAEVVSAGLARCERRYAVPAAGSTGQVLAVVAEGRLSGRVVGPAGAPVGGAAVRVTGCERCSVVSDADGGFTLDRLEPGAAQVEVSAPGLTPFVARAAVVSGKTTTLPALTLRAGAALRIAAVEGAEPCAGAWVMVVPRDGPAQQQLLDARGEATFAGLPPGPVFVQVDRERTTLLPARAFHPPFLVRGQRSPARPGEARLELLSGRQSEQRFSF